MVLVLAACSSDSGLDWSQGDDATGGVDPGAVDAGGDDAGPAGDLTGGTGAETGDETGDTGDETGDETGETGDTGDETGDTGDETGDTGDETGDETGDPGDETGETGETGDTGGEPADCEEDGDCAGACPLFPAGCVCGETPDGAACVPACMTDDDCVGGPDAPALHCEAALGRCVPGEPVETGCEGDDDCAGELVCDLEAGTCGPADPGLDCEQDCAEACPDLPLGCVCGETPQGPTCIAACETDDDCPTAPDGGMLSCDTTAGTCSPGEPPDAGCADELDCLDACGAEALGCACEVGPDGVGQCVATCVTTGDCVGVGEALVCLETGLCGPEETPPGCASDHDCPLDPEGQAQVCSEDGACVPADVGPAGPTSCAVEADCVGACPAGSVGCTCEATPMGDLCVPTCETDEDCPAGEGLVCLLAKHICVPEGGPPGG